MDELLASIRQAIHDRVEPGRAAGRAASPKLVHTTPPAPDEAAPGTETDADTDADTGPMKRTIVTSGRDGFAGLLGGDVRLEEALARLNHTGWRGGAEAPAAGEAAAAVAEKLRPTIAEWAGGPASAVATAPEKTAASRWPGVSRQTPPERKERRQENPMHTERPAAPQRPAQRDLLSSEAASAAHAAFNQLTSSNADRSAGRERGLDEMTRECLRPLLKDWLDRNLPDVVERLVREEIKRVARSGR
jgi:cell pole-organizing protein PopZ